MTPAEKIATELRTVGVKAYILDSAPAEKVNVVAVTPYTGSPIDTDQGIVGDTQRLQCYVRGLDYDAGYLLIWECYRFLLGAMQSGVEFEGYRIRDFMQSPSYLGLEDKSKHALFSFNFNINSLFEE